MHQDYDMLFDGIESFEEINTYDLALMLKSSPRVELHDLDQIARSSDSLFGVHFRGAFALSLLRIHLLYIFKFILEESPLTPNVGQAVMISVQKVKMAI